ncbi:hypothetical protein QQ045_019875 [Rhodiola kirilowii]
MEAGSSSSSSSSMQPRSWWWEAEPEPEQKEIPPVRTTEIEQVFEEEVAVPVRVSEIEEVFEDEEQPPIFPRYELEAEELESDVETVAVKAGFEIEQSPAGQQQQQNSSLRRRRLGLIGILICTVGFLITLPIALTNRKPAHQSPPFTTLINPNLINLNQAIIVPSG